MAWMPALTRKIKISYSIIYVLLGMLIYLVPGGLLPLPDPISKNEFTVRLTELVVIISLMGTGLKIDQPFSFRNWAVPFRLVSITMILSIGIVMCLAMWLFNFDPASALLLGAVLAPTDPVLAADVQVGPPLEEVRDDVKFSLTAEAGMNDGTAFPFTWLAIALVVGEKGLGEWFWDHLVYQIVVGVAMGFALGKAVAFLLFRLPRKAKEIGTSDGFVGLALTLVVYGLTEMVHGYGFIAVFVAAITLRNSEMHHRYHLRMHEFSDQVERILVAIVLVLFGGSLISGVLQKLNWTMALFAFIFVLLIRPLTSMVGMMGVKLHRKQKWAISFFGIKGMGSFYYLAFALNEAFFPLNEELWAIGAFVVLLSIIVHGFTANPVMHKIEMEFAEKPQHQKEPFASGEHTEDQNNKSGKDQ